MKKNLVAALAIFAIVLPACTPKDKDKKQDEVAAESFQSTTNIRYVDLDSLLANYEFAKLTAEETVEIARKYQEMENTLGAQLQNQANKIQQKLQSNGYLSEASFRADEDDFNKRQAAVQRNLAAKADETQTLINAKQKAVLDSIESYIKVYNSEKKYDAILYKNAGLYFNPSLDITDEVTKNLNARYEKAKGETK